MDIVVVQHNQNVPLHIIKELAGHSSLRVMVGYITASESGKKEAAAKLKLPGRKPGSKKVLDSHRRNR